MPTELKKKIEPSKVQLLLLLTLEYMKKLISAIPVSVKMHASNPDAPDLFLQSTQIFVKDLFPMLLLYGMHAAIQCMYQSKEEDTLAIKITSALVVMASYLFTATLLLRQKIAFLMHSAVLSMVYPKAFAEATKEMRLKTDVKLRTENATTASRVKGEVCGLLAFFIQQTMIPVIELTPHAIGVLSKEWGGIPYADVSGEYLGWMLGMISRISHSGQFIADTRLTSGEMCEEDRTKYLHQHPEVFLAPGLLHYFLNNGFGFIYHGVEIAFSPFDLSVYTKMRSVLDVAEFLYKTVNLIAAPLATLSIFYLIGLMHYTSLPAKKDNASDVGSYLCDPMMGVRRVFGPILDLLLPGIFKKFDEKVAARKEYYEKIRMERAKLKKTDNNEFEFIEVPEQTYFDVLKNIINHNWVRKYLRWALPQLIQDTEALKKDYIIEKYWFAVAKKTVEVGDVVLKYRKTMLAAASLSEFYKKYLEPVQLYASILSCVLPVTLLADQRVLRLGGNIVSSIASLFRARSNAADAAKFVSAHNSMINDFNTLFVGMPRGVVMIVVALLRNQAAVDMFEKKIGALRLCVLSEEQARSENCDFDKETKLPLQSPAKPSEFYAVPDVDDCDRSVTSQTYGIFQPKDTEKPKVQNDDFDLCGGVDLRRAGTYSAPVFRRK